MLSIKLAATGETTHVHMRTHADLRLLSKSR